MPATVIAERVAWPYSIRTLSSRVTDLRPVYLPPDPASRTSYLAGEIAQRGFWFPDIEVPGGVRSEALGDRVAGADDGGGVLALGVSGAGLDPARGGSVHRVVAAHQHPGGGAAGVGLGRRGRGRGAVARKAQRAHRWLPGIPHPQ